MKNCRSVSFNFKGKEYYAMIRHQQANGKGFYYVRIMNQKLDSLLNKANQRIMHEENGMICLSNKNGVPKEQELLRIAIVDEIFREKKRTNDRFTFSWIDSYNLLTPY